MTNRAAAVVLKPTVPSLAERLAAGRLPLDLALSLAVELVDAVATAHQQRHAFGLLTAADFVVQRDGSVAVTAAPRVDAEPAGDLFSVGAVLYRVFTGVTPNQARAQLKVSPLHAVPPASLLNPALDDSIEELLAKLLNQDPALRPHSLRIVEALLADVCDALDLDPSRDALAAWAATAPITKPAPVRHRPTLRLVEADELEDEEDDEDAREEDLGPLRFDAWAAAVCAFTFVAFAMATHL